MLGYYVGEGTGRVCSTVMPPSGCHLKFKDKEGIREEKRSSGPRSKPWLQLALMCRALNKEKVMCRREDTDDLINSFRIPGVSHFRLDGVDAAAIAWRFDEQFNEGVLYAASVLIATHDVPTMAATIIREAGLGQADCSGLDDFDKNHLRKIQGESGIAQIGL